MGELAREVGAEFGIINIPLDRPFEENRDYPSKRLGGYARRQSHHLIDVYPTMLERNDGAPEPLYWH